MPGAAFDPARLHALADHLGQPAASVARTLHDELTAAHSAIERAIAAGDLATAGAAAHRARNSVLMLDARRLLLGLRALQQAADAGDARAARAAWDRLRPDLGSLVDALAQLS